ncbi:DNA (cytosine-5-)-methyltransferase [Clostridium intestinale]|uniref:Methyltransferase domain-containing protein n=1 Tax=Clostridium intestinale TaxID=36845 RepID=A0A7D6ZIR7_9CLOT|nr:DNA (cytosine-5-)-methyltransferase [Clostridium intestinale]QLY81541.1 methyltransferase domain-containing protein [Clostridium intestinale]
MSKVKLSIGELRKIKGVTQVELAEYLGVSFQAVSKWENGTSMPDIEMLPMLSKYFEVSVDEILGLKSLKDKAYICRGTDQKDFWDKKLDYLKDSRNLLWNDDYFEFLIKKVWKIDKPINIIDFGCGYGYLGMKLLPLLPQGSSYTGVDISDSLIKEGNQYFNNSSYKFRFINKDLNSFDIKDKYDMAICQTLLRHLPNPKEILEKMIDSTVEGGIVVCVEVNRMFENSGMYIKGIEYNSTDTNNILHKLWETELHEEGRDFSIGIKMPFYMDELGLKNIDVRLCDKVNFISPNSDMYEKNINALISANNWDRSISINESNKCIDFLMSRGLSKSEAEEYIKEKLDIQAYVMKNKEDISILNTLCLIISYGVKEN